MSEPSAIFQYAQAFYDKLVENSGLEESDIRLEGNRIFRGSLTEIFNSIGASNAYYSQIREFLTRGDDPYIVIVRQGTRGFDSIIALRRRPEVGEGISPRDLTRDPARATISVADLEERLARLERWRESLTKGDLDIVEALRNHERRLAQLEQEREADNSGKTTQE